MSWFYIHRGIGAALCCASQSHLGSRWPSVEKSQTLQMFRSLPEPQDSVRSYRRQSAACRILQQLQIMHKLCQFTYCCLSLFPSPPCSCCQGVKSVGAITKVKKFVIALESHWQTSRTLIHKPVLMYMHLPNSGNTAEK